MKRKIRIILFIITSIVAILIVSFTLGREWYEGKNQSIFSFALIHFSGYLFFLLMPVELAYIYYLSFFNDFEMFAVALLTAFAAQLIDYFIGFSVSSAIVNNLVGEERIKNAEKHIQKYGNLTIFIFNLLPLSSSVNCSSCRNDKIPVYRIYYLQYGGFGCKIPVINYS